MGLRLTCSVVLLALALAASPAQAGFKLLTGSYVGDGTSPRTVPSPADGNLGFQPDLVMVKGDAAQYGVISLTPMGDDVSKEFATTATTSGYIISISGAGAFQAFRVGSDARVNAVGTTYYWIAMQADSSDMYVGSYVGNGSGSNRNITVAIGFQPEFTWVLPANANTSPFRSEAMPANISYNESGSTSTTKIVGVHADGFTIGTSSGINGNGVTFYYVSIKANSNFKQSSYLGTGSTDYYTGVSGVGFTPEWVMLCPGNPRIKTTAYTGTKALALKNFAGSTLKIPALCDCTGSSCICPDPVDGFAAGTEMNVSGTTYYYQAFKRWDTVSATVAEVRTSSAEAFDDGVLVRWRTGYERDNLGFHVYRKAGGTRVRLTPSLVAGSALLFGPRTALPAGYSYAWWDDAPAAERSAARYWIEDVDLQGRRSLHGPILPARMTGPPSRPHSPLLDDLGRDSRTATIIERPVGRSLIALHGPSGAPWALAGRQAVKVLVGADGWYRVGFDEIRAAGLDVPADAALLQVFADGAEQPVAVADDGVEFFGRGVDTSFTDKRTYWIVAGTEPGRRIPVSSGPGSGPIAEDFPNAVERRDRLVYLAALLNGDADNFFGAPIGGTPLELVLPVRHLDADAAAEATLEVSLQGVTDDIEDPMDHHVRVSFGGVGLGVIDFDGMARARGEYSLPTAGLREGDNVVTLVSEGAETDRSLVDFVRLTYRRDYVAEGDVLRFSVPDGYRARVDGFSRADVRVVDVTTPDDPYEIRATVEASGAGFAATIDPPRGGTRELLAFAAPAVRHPAAILPNAPVSVREIPGADLVVLTRAVFRDAVAPLVALRESQGLSVAVVDVEEVYDEFHYGEKDPAAIRAFLLWTQTNWSPRPSFLLLVGDASFDPHDHLGFGDTDIVPTHLVDATFNETASDDWFGDLDDDDLPEVAVGRLPVRTADEARAVVAKIVGYGTDGASDWRSRVLLVSDHDDGFHFEDMTTEARAAVPDGFTVDEILRDGRDDATVRSEILAKLGEGQLFVNYVGHGSVEVWTGDGLLTSDDAATLGNGPRLPFVASMTCLNGFFHDLYTDSLAESLLRAEGGAAAVWASSGLTEPAGQAAIDQALMRSLLAGDTRTIGEATLAAKAATIDVDVRRTWVLFGDPSMRLALPTPGPDPDADGGDATEGDAAGEDGPDEESEIGGGTDGGGDADAGPEAAGDDAVSDVRSGGGGCACRAVGLAEGDATPALRLLASLAVLAGVNRRTRRGRRKAA